MRYTVDRIEGTIAVCEADDGTMHNVPAEELPEGIKPGDILTDDGGAWAVDTQAIQERSERIRRKMDSLWK